MSIRLSGVFLFLATACCNVAFADTHRVQLTLDAMQLKPGVLFGSNRGGKTSLSIGDSLAVDIKFLPGQTVVVDQPLSFGLLAGGVDLGRSIQFTVDSSLTLRGADGGVLGEGKVSQSSSGNALQSLFFADQLGIPMWSRLSLSGLSFTTTVLAYGDGARQHVFSEPRVSLVAGRLDAAVSPVPEPAQSMLALLGLGALGLQLVRKQRAGTQGPLQST